MATTELDKGVLYLHCNGCNTSDTSFEVPRESVVHLDETGESVVYYATCPDGHKNPIEFEYLARIQEVQSVVQAFSVVTSSNRARRIGIERASQLKEFISELDITIELYFC